jgi:iron complex outermembrane receptor protein
VAGFIRPAAAQQEIIVAGRITDARTGTPLAGATVRYRPNGGGLTNVISTGPDGRFRITLGRPGTVGFSRGGYATVERAITSSDSALTVSLSPLGAQDTRAATARTLERLTVTAVRASDAAPIARSTLDREQLERDYSGQDVPLTLRQAPSVTAYTESGSLLNYSYFRVRGIDPTNGEQQ